MKIWVSTSVNKHECRAHVNKPTCHSIQGWLSAGYETLGRRFLAEMICTSESALPTHGTFDLTMVEFKEVNIEKVRAK
jgi:hypothetical protein